MNKKMIFFLLLSTILGVQSYSMHAMKVRNIDQAQKVVIKNRGHADTLLKECQSKKSKKTRRQKMRVLTALQSHEKYKKLVCEALKKMEDEAEVGAETPESEDHVFSLSSGSEDYNKPVRRKKSKRVYACTEESLKKFVHGRSKSIKLLAKQRPEFFEKLKNNQCPEMTSCGKRFSKMHGLQEHFLSSKHFNAELFKCVYCDLKQNNRSNADVHFIRCEARKRVENPMPQEENVKRQKVARISAKGKT